MGYGLRSCAIAADGAAEEARSPRQFLDEIGSALTADPERRMAFATELERTIANDTQALLIARLDNLGKGASGAAVQSMNVHLGLDEGLGL